MEAGKFDKVLELLESGSQFVRDQACQKLVAIAESCDSVVTVLDGLYPHIFSPKWETRTVASKALGSIIRKQVGKPHKSDENISNSCAFSSNIIFDIYEALQLGELLANEGKHFEFAKMPTSVTRAEINRELGLNAKLVGVDSSEWLKDEDIVETGEPARRIHSKLERRKSLHAVEFAVKNELELTGKLERILSDLSLGSMLDRLLTDEICSPDWQHRHGAAVALKALIGEIGAELRKSDPDLADLFAMKCAVILLVVAARDRFGDFLGVTAVAPVRESVAQAVSTAANYVSSSAFSILCFGWLTQFTLVSLPWECAHFALLTLKYLLPLSSVSIDHFLPFIRRSLSADNDDLSSSASHALVSIVDRLQHCEHVDAILSACESLVANSADESVAAGLELWMRLVPFASEARKVEWEFFRALFAMLDSELGEIRQVALRAFKCALDGRASVEEQTDAKSRSIPFSCLDLNEPRTCACLQLLYRRLLCEPDERIATDLIPFWRLFVRRFAKPKGELLTLIGVWLSFLMVPESAPKLDSRLLAMVNCEQFFHFDVTSNRCLIGGDSFSSLPTDSVDREELVWRAKTRGARALAAIFDLVSAEFESVDGTEPAAMSLNSLFVFHWSTSSSLQRFAVAIALREWFRAEDSHAPEWMKEMKSRRITCIDESLIHSLEKPPSHYDEFTPNLAELSAHAQSLAIEFAKTGALAPDSASPTVEQLSCLHLETVKNSSVRKDLESKRDALALEYERVSAMAQSTIRRVSALASAALLEMRILPSTFNPVVKPLMDSVKAETSGEAVRMACESVATLFDVAKTPNEKILRNLCTLRCLRDSSTQCENAARALVALVEHFGAKVPQELALLWRRVRFEEEFSGEKADECAQLLITVYPSLASELQMELIDVLEPFVDAALRSLDRSRNRLACALMTIITERYPAEALNRIWPEASVQLEGESPLGKILVLDFIRTLIERIDARIVGSISLLAPPLMPLMSNSDEEVRSLSASTFASLVRLMPLESAPMSGLSEDLMQAWNRNFDFLDQLTHPDRTTKVQLPFKLSIELRPYQHEGISWLCFLAKYRLHGILADDMGLGKTLQTLCVIATSHLFGEEGAVSLVVCPTTLVAHWSDEIERYFVDERPLRVFALSSKKSLSIPPSTNLLIVSYDLLRREADFFASREWNYCVLDEGHVIKNSKTALFHALERIRARHRLILSGTPIQNSVLELWSLFEFLMPGYLGSAAAFNARFAKPILASRDAKASSGEAEAGQRALERLHKQCLPFVMRRQKSDVLRDLPPKIVQDYYCSLSDLQVKLYEDFSSTVQSSSMSSNNALQILAYLRKLCDHPSLVLSPTHPKFAEISSKLNIYDPLHSGKLVALAELLAECGIGRTGEHRALIFCQFKAMIDLIAKLIDQGQLAEMVADGSDDQSETSIRYLRLDGSVPTSQRAAIVERFNRDLSIDLLLLTTQVGGLGLNLTGADVVIFIDHDWNPVRDLQAMDRAHRLGQRRTVNVYRLITRATLEEKIMHLQAFKTRVAETVVGDENRSFTSMATDELLDLLTLDQQAAGDSKPQSETKTKRRRIEKAEEIALDQIWDTSLYEDAFDVGQFLKSLR